MTSADTTDVRNAAVLAHLEEYGYAVTEPLLTSKECDAVVDKQWEFVEAASGHAVRRSDPQSWRASDTPDPRHRSALWCGALRRRLGGEGSPESGGDVRQPLRGEGRRVGRLAVSRALVLV